MNLVISFRLIYIYKNISYLEEGITCEVVFRFTYNDSNFIFFKNENKNVNIFKPENLSLDGKKRAEQTYEFALKISPSNPDALFNLGLLKF